MEFVGAWFGSLLAAENLYCTLAAAVAFLGAAGATLLWRNEACCAGRPRRAACAAALSPGGSTHASSASLWDNDPHLVSWERLSTPEQLPAEPPTPPRGRRVEFFFAPVENHGLAGSAPCLY